MVGPPGLEPKLLFLSAYPTKQCRGRLTSTATLQNPKDRPPMTHDFVGRFTLISLDASKK